MTKKTVRIGNAGGFWGDDLNALRRQLTGGPLDYITADYLAEITMSILRKQQLAQPELGYVSDFIDQMVDVADILATSKVRLIVNAGGINPVGCARMLLQKLEGNTNLKVAVIEGDNLYDRIDEIYPAQANFKNMDTGDDFAEIRSRIQSANAYLGLPPLLKALESGANVIIAGRVTDTSITMAPLVHEFGWKLNDWDKLAAALVAGHIIECGAQATGGNYTDWHKVQRWDNFGYPIVEVTEDGNFVVTKHPNTGGVVNVDTIREQLVYEMGDPAYYISPDVVADFRTIKLEHVGADKVRVFGIKGGPSTPFLKVSMAYNDGYKATSSIILSGGNALAKARAFGDLFWKRLNINFVKKNTEFVGYNACHRNLAATGQPNEILLQFSVFDYDKNKINEFSKSIAPLILSGPPGVAVTGGRPKPHSVMTYWPTLVPKPLVNTRVSVLALDGSIESTVDVTSITGYEQPVNLEQSPKQISGILPPTHASEYGNEDVTTIHFSELCLARSGDKGDTANIGVIARSPEVYTFIKKYLTADVLKSMFAEVGRGQVIRFELDNLLALNFLLEHSLDGGGTKSLMIDAQGKTYAQALLNQYVTIPRWILDSVKP